jgi:CRP/FNR family transcriptional regulator
MACTHHHCLHIVPVFSNLDDSQMEIVSGITRERIYQDGELIYRAGESGGALIVVHTGKVKIYRLDTEGRQQVIRIINPGEFTGELSIFSDQPADDYAQAIGECSVCIVQAEKMRSVMEQFPLLTLQITQELSRRLSQSDQALHSVLGKTVEQRVAGYLLELSVKQQTDELLLPVTKGTIASLLGMSQETLSRRLALLQEEGIISIGRGKRITIVDKQSLLEKNP